MRGIHDQLPDVPGEGQPDHDVVGPAVAAPLATMAPPCRSLARSMVSPSSWRGSGTTWPCARSLATPPSGKIDKRRWVYRQGSVTPNVLRVSAASGERGTITVQPAGSASSAGLG